MSATTASTTATVERPIVPVTRPQGEKLPSSFLSDPEWLQLLRLNICGVFNKEETAVESYLLAEADYLLTLLKARLNKHIQEKVLDVKKHEHLVFTFVRSNLNRLSAMLVYFGHAMTDLRRANENTCLLGRVEAFLRATDILLEGCYTVYDPIESVWIRSGKAVGSASSSPRAGLLNRWEGKSGHRATAGKITADETNKFALCYPTRSNPINLPSTRRGYFDDLELYVGLGFNRDSETAGLTSTDADGSNIVLEQRSTRVT